MKTPTLYLNPSFITLATMGVLMDPKSRMAVATDGEAIALAPISEGFTQARLIPQEKAHEISPDSGEPSDVYDLTQLVTPPGYRIALNPAKLATLAAAIGAENLVIIELPAHPSEGPLKLTCLNSDSLGYLMPQPMPDDLQEGILINLQSQISNLQSPPAEPAPLPPPIVTANAERHTLEIAFGGVPPKEIREALKDPALGFRYSGRGTRRGVPPAMWYGPDNPFTREKISTLLGVEIAAAIAA